jgi:hypothetical protein
MFSNIKRYRTPGVVDLDPDWIRIQWGPWIRIRIKEGKMTQKNRKQLINFRRAECSFLRAEGFSCRLDGIMEA